MTALQIARAQFSGHVIQGRTFAGFTARSLWSTGQQKVVVEQAVLAGETTGGPEVFGLEGDPERALAELHLVSATALGGR